MEVSEARTLIDVLVDRSGDLSPRVLVLGEPGGAVTDALTAPGGDDEVVNGDWPSIQLPRRFDLVLVEPTPPIVVHELVAMVHCAVQHLVPGGVLATMLPADDAQIPASRFVVDARLRRSPWVDDDWSVHRRTERHTIHDMVFEARARIGRVTAVDLAATPGERHGAARPRHANPHRPPPLRCHSGLDARSADGPRVASRPIQRVPPSGGDLLRRTHRHRVQRRLQLVPRGGEPGRPRVRGRQRPHRWPPGLARRRPPRSNRPTTPTSTCDAHRPETSRIIPTLRANSVAQRPNSGIFGFRSVGSWGLLW